MSKALYEEAASKDKSIKLYEGEISVDGMYSHFCAQSEYYFVMGLGMWHSINIGESEENLEIVFNDAIEWILDRS